MVNMIRELVVQGVTVFPEREYFEFVPGINIVIGGNDSGKSHLLKLCYSVAQWSSIGGKKSLPDKWAEEQRLRNDLMRVFSSHDLAGLTALNRGNSHAEVEVSLEGHGVPEGTGRISFEFLASEEEEGLHITRMPQRFLHSNVIFLTARDVLSIYPGFIQIGKSFPDILDGACWDLCKALDCEPVEKLTDVRMGRVLARIEKILGGELMRQDGRFYLKRPGQIPMEMSLVAEGFKRLGTLGCLVRNEVVKQGTVLFLDEPEMNLNSLHLPRLVKVLLELAKAGVQVVLTSHSLFMIRELVMQLKEEKNAKVTKKFFGLKVPTESRFGVRVSSGSELEDLGEIESMQAEIEQADRYLSSI